MKILSKMRNWLESTNNQVKVVIIGLLIIGGMFILHCYGIIDLNPQHIHL